VIDALGSSLLVVIDASAILALVIALLATFAFVTAVSANLIVVIDASGTKFVHAEPLQYSGEPSVVFNPKVGISGDVGLVSVVQTRNCVPMNVLMSVTFAGAIVVALAAMLT
jgi:hypothetical protein